MPDETNQEEVKPAPSVDYTVVGEEKKKKGNSKKNVKILIPNGKMITGFILVTLGVLIMAALNFPIGSFLMATKGATGTIGYPFVFIVIELSQETHLNVIALLQDLLIYLGLAYLINIFLNLIGKLSNFKTKESADVSPTTYKDQKITNTDKLAEKISQ